MNRIIPRSLAPLVNRWVLLAIACVLGLQLGAAPVLAQNGGGNSSLSRQEKQKLQKQLKSAYQQGAKAGNAGNYDQAIANFEEALNLAQKLELSSVSSQIQNSLVESLKGAASAALEQENYPTALDHYERVLEYRKNDPVIHFNRGIAYMSMDSTDSGLRALQTAVSVGNETGNTRVAGRATQRIRDEFLAQASKALQGNNISQEQVDTAISALDEMRKYVEPSSKSLFYRSRALFEGGQYEQAVQTAREGLEMHQGSRSDAAKFYFVIAESQMSLGNKSQACETFKNAAFGDYKARSEHYLKNECQ